MRAFAQIQEEVPEARLIFLGGDCGMKGYLMQKRQNLRNPDQVILIDQLPREQLVGFYQRSRVCVIPSLWENYPYVCLEAMACAKAVVASATGGLRTLISPGLNGLLVPPGSSRSLAEAVIRVLKDPELCSRLGVAARAAMETNFAPDKIAYQTLEVYSALLKN